MDIQLIVLAIIAAVPPTLVGLASLFQATRTHRIVNSRMTELLELTRKSSEAKGTLDEKERVK
jgi:hypothetical protein